MPDPAAATEPAPAEAEAEAKNDAGQSRYTLPVHHDLTDRDAQATSSSRPSRSR